MSSSPSSNSSSSFHHHQHLYHTTNGSSSPTKNKLNNLINLPADSQTASSNTMHSDPQCKRIRLSDSIDKTDLEPHQEDSSYHVLVHKSPKVRLIILFFYDFFLSIYLYILIS